MKLSKRMADAYGMNSSVSTNKKENEHLSKLSAQSDSTNQTPPPGGKIQRVARYLFLLDPKESSSILQHMPKEQADTIRFEMLKVTAVSPEERVALLAEFAQLSDTDQVKSQQKPFESPPNPTVSAPIDKILIQEKGVPFSFLKEKDPSVVLALCERESAQSISVMVSFLEPQKSAQVIMLLPPEIKQQVVRRLVGKKNLKRDLVESVENLFRNKLSDAGLSLEGEPFDGAEAIAKILKYMSGEDRTRLIDELEAEDIGLGARIKENLFSIDDLIFVDNRGLQIFLEGFGDNDLVYILRDKPISFVEKIRENLSSRRLVLLDEESDFVGPVRRSEVKERTALFIDMLRKEADAGRIVILRDVDGNEYV